MSDRFEDAIPASEWKKKRPKKPQVELCPDRLPPHAPDAEMAIIGCCLIAPKTAIPRCDEKLVGGLEAFYDVRHQEIYQCLLGAFNLDEHIDQITIGNRLGPRFNELGGHDYLAKCQDLTPSAANLDYYLDIVNEKRVLRNVISACTSVASKAYEHSGSLDGLMDQLERQVMDASARNQPKEILSPDKLSELMQQDLERRFELQGKMSGMDTGFVDLNRKLDGFHPGEVVVIGARPSQGKTALGLNILAHAVLNKTPSLFVSLEMSAEALMRRMLSSYSKTPMGNIRNGSFDQQAFVRIASFSALVKKSPIHIIDGASGMSCREICSAIRKMVIQHGIKLVVVDYLQKVRPDIRHDMRTYEVADVSGKLKAVCAETKVAMVVLSQLNRDRDKENRPPRLSDLGESGQIERDADVVVLIHRTEESDMLIVAKQRDGETGIVPIRFNGPFCRFENAAYETDDNE